MNQVRSFTSSAERPRAGQHARGASSGRALLAALMATLAAALACGGPQEGAGAGSDCFRDADCNEGLVCVEGACSNDVEPLVSTVEGPAGEAAATGAMTTGTGGAQGTMGAAAMTASVSGSGGNTSTTTTQGAAGAAGSP